MKQIITALVAGGLALSLMGCTSNQFNKAIDTAQDIINESQDETNRDLAVNIGEVIADDNNVEFCVTSVENTQTIGEGYLAVSTDNNYIMLTVNVDDKGAEPYDVNALNFILMNGDTEYQYCSDALLAVENQMYVDTINPGLSQEYKLVYETPITVEEGDWRLKIVGNAYLDKTGIYINLN